jgi:nucleoside-diphosphate-sugar epimerase
MRVLLTGAAGWLGRHLKPRLQALGHEVVGLDIAASPWTDAAPASLGRVYDAALAEQALGFRAAADFAVVLAALREDRPLPFAHDPGFLSPSAAFD